MSGYAATKGACAIDDGADREDGAAAARIRVLFFSHYFPPEGNAPASRTFEHCTRWARAGADVTVVTCAPNCPGGVVYPGYRNRFRSQVEVVHGIRVVRVWTYVAANAGFTRRIANYLSYMFAATLASIGLPRPDVVVATSPQFFCGWAGVFASRLKRAPLVLEIRDIWPESIAAVGAIRNRWVLRLLERLERWLYLAARHIVAVGEGYRQNIVGKIGLPDRISVITNGVDLEQFAPQEPDGDFRRGLDLEGKFVCSYVGTIGMAHGLEVAVEAAEILARRRRRDIVFCIVGDGASRKSLQQRVRDLGLADNVRFLGRQPKERIPALLASSDACLIHLKKCDLFATVIPSKIFETMAMGRPIIMGVMGEACDIVLEAGAGIRMEPGSAESLVQAVTRLADDPALVTQLGTAARSFVASHYNRDDLARRFLQRLRCVVAAREMPAAMAKEP